MTESRPRGRGGLRAASLVLLVAASLGFGGTAKATGGDYVFVGGSEPARETARTALDRSRFDWDLVSRQITIRIVDCGCAWAAPGEVVLDEKVLTDARFGPKYAWGIVQHEYAHQVAFLLGPRARKAVSAWLGGLDWCYEDASVAHDDHGCERFAAALAWAYWPSRYNVMRWETSVAPAQFRERVDALLARPTAIARRGG